jgi:predicted acetyltransferase
MDNENIFNSPKTSETVSGQNAVLIEPTQELIAEFLDMAEEYRAGGDDLYKSALEDFSAYLQQALNFAAGVNLKFGLVRANEYWLVDGRRIIGRSKLRHWLTPALEHEGGHIGYGIRASARRKGYGTLILRLTLERAKIFGLHRVLVTCDTDNTGSAKIIEKNGGRLAGRVVSNRTGKQVSQYWIEI